ncbi:hypothetical protein ACWJJH_18345 [Endozoicomonadaceae bacterium StTr2]
MRQILRGLQAGLLLWVVISSGMASAVQDKSEKTSAIPEAIYGSWWLINPKVVEQNMIAGALIICNEAMAGQPALSCGKDSFSFVLLERNTGHGCTDYVAMGKVISQDNVTQLLPDEANQPFLVLKADENQLILAPAEGGKWVFERVSSDEIDQRVENACEASRLEYERQRNKP